MRTKFADGGGRVGKFENKIQLNKERGEIWKSERATSYPHGARETNVMSGRVPPSTFLYSSSRRPSPAPARAPVPPPLRRLLLEPPGPRGASPGRTGRPGGSS
ncbi:unnamed protein product, partial [Nesidiocoris tenuis]